MYYRYSTALSHIFLAIVSGYCLKKYVNGQGYYYPILSYSIVLTNSLSGIWRWGNPANGAASNAIYSHSRVLQTLFTFPCIVMELWLRYHQHFAAYLHIVFSCALWLSFWCKKSRDKCIDIFIALNILSCFVISVSTENWYGITLGLSYGINHFILHEGCEIFEMPTIDFYNYALCFFLPFSLKALVT